MYSFMNKTVDKNKNIAVMILPVPDLYKQTGLKLTYCSERQYYFVLGIVLGFGINSTNEDWSKQMYHSL